MIFEGIVAVLVGVIVALKIVVAIVVIVVDGAKRAALVTAAAVISSSDHGSKRYPGVAITVWWLLLLTLPFSTRHQTASYVARLSQSSFIKNRFVYSLFTFGINTIATRT